MRLFIFGIAVLALPPFTFAQADIQQKTYQLQRTSKREDVNDLATAARTISDANGVNTNATARTITLKGNADQLKLADWVIAELDQAELPGADGPYSYPIKERDEAQVARIFVVPGAQNAEDFNARQTVLRTITDIRRVYPFWSRKAIVVRATKEQMALAEWLLTEFDREASSGDYTYTPASPAPSAASGRDTAARAKADPRANSPEPEPEIVHVFHYWRSDEQDFNQLQTFVRTLTEMRRFYPFVSAHEIAVRGSPADVKFTGWLIEQLQQQLPLSSSYISPAYPVQAPAANAAAASTSTPNNPTRNNPPANLVAQLFYVAGSVDPKVILDRDKAIRDATGLRRVYAFTSARVFGVVGTPDQLAKVAALVAQ